MKEATDGIGPPTTRGGIRKATRQERSEDERRAGDEVHPRDRPDTTVAVLARPVAWTDEAEQLTENDAMNAPTARAGHFDIGEIYAREDAYGGKRFYLAIDTDRLFTVTGDHKEVELINPPGEWTWRHTIVYELLLNWCLTVEDFDEIVARILPRPEQSRGALHDREDDESARLGTVAQPHRWHGGPWKIGA